MDEVSTHITRRTAFVAGGIGALALAALPGIAEAAPRSDVEKANVKLVKNFCQSWNDADKAATFLSDDAAVRMVEDKPAVIGPAAFTAAFKGFMSHGETISVKILTSYAKGPLVVNTRVDTLKTPGKPDQPFKVVGVFIVKDGKIKEWSDYLEA
jgi:limonene-1,2-epoxide hydrolase